MAHDLSRRDFVRVVAGTTGALATSPLLGASREANQQRPNILWIVSEDTHPFLGCYGDPNATTPNIDKLASEGVVYENVLCNAPVCAPARFTIITGTYAPRMGTMHMRSRYRIPEEFRFFTQYLREAGYYCTNNAKEDYNTIKPEGAWDESSSRAHYKNRRPGQPFFAVFNSSLSHEHKIHYHELKEPAELLHKPEDMILPPYHPDLPEIRLCWANFYDAITQMDRWVGELLRELEEAGLAEDTIVFYYGDNGGILPRSKRFLYESGARVPLIVRFPRKYRHLAPAPPGSRVRELVQFADLAPTILSLAGIPKPKQMQGRAFLGPYREAEPQFVFCYRDRMDERYDMMRSVRDRQFLYIRNYYPHLPYGHHHWYLWRSPATRAWERAYREGKCNRVQSRFWQPKPTEELYDVQADPHNIRNLAEDPEYAPVLEKMREAHRRWIRENRDAGFLPEGWMVDETGERTPYELTHSSDFPVDDIIETAEFASERKLENLRVLMDRLSHKHPAVRYWAAVGCGSLGQSAREAGARLADRLDDPVADVRIAAAEALVRLGGGSEALKVLVREMNNVDNPRAQLRALNALHALGKQARPALKQIMAFPARNRTTDNYVHRAFVTLLKQLKPGWEDYVIW